MPVRTEERADDLAKFCTKIKLMAHKKGLNLYEYLDILTASICSVAIRNDFSKDDYLRIFNRFWDGLQEKIEAE